MTPSSDAALKAEIARLTGRTLRSPCVTVLTCLLGAINQHKSTQQAFGSAPGPPGYRKSNTYVNPNYKPPSSYRSQAYHSSTSRYVRPPHVPKPQAAPSSTHDIVIDGVAFETSSRSLVRKDRKYLHYRLHETEGDPTVKSLASVPVPKPTSAPKVPTRPIPQQDFSRTTNGHRIPVARAYKSKVSRQPRARNMTLDNTRGSTQSVYHMGSAWNSRLTSHSRGRRSYKRMKYIDKPCPRFTTTGASSILTYFSS